MRRFAVFVDAGYFWVQITNIILGGRAQRNKLSIDYDILRSELLSQARSQFPSVDLLRVYWYDGPGPDGKTPDHHALENLDDIKLRLGTRNGVGAQKAVDGLIIADMISLAQSKAISDALLISGDADLTPGVIAAQNLGIRVHLLSMGSATATSPYLRSEMDFKHHWDDGVIKLFAKPTNTQPQVVVAEVKEAEPVVDAEVDKDLARVAAKVSAEIDKAVLSKINPKDLLPKEIDGKLLSVAKAAIGRSLDVAEKRQVRSEFKKHLSKQ